MNKPVTLLCMCIAALGLLVLGRCAYCSLVYGHGDWEAGNFNRCWYSATRDPQTGRLVREWDVVGESTEDTIVDRLDMWFVGIGLLVLGGTVYVLEHHGSHRHYA